MQERSVHFVWPVLGILAAGLMFSNLNPDLTNEIGSAVIRGLLTVGALFGIAALLESTVSLSMRFVYRLAAGLVVVVGAWSVGHLFDASLANTALMTVTIVAVGILGFLTVSNSQPTAATSGHHIHSQLQGEIASVQPGLGGIVTMFRAELRAALSALHVQTATNVEHIETLRHGGERLPSETAAVAAANRGAEELRIHPTVYNSQSYQESKLDADIKMKLDVFSLQLELAKLRGETETKIDGVIDLTTRPIRELEKYHAKLVGLHQQMAKLVDIADPALRQTMMQQFSLTLDAVLREFHARFGLEPDSQAPFGAHVG